MSSADRSGAVEVRVFATLRKQCQPKTMVILENSTTIRDITTRLDIPESELAIILLNGRHADLDNPIKADDVLSLFPPVGGG